MKNFLILGTVLLCILVAAVGITAWGGREVAEAPTPTPIPTEAPTPTPEPTEAPKPYETEIESIIAKRFSSLSGNCYWGVHTFSDGATYQNTSKAVPSASIVKMFMMDYVYYRIHTVGDLSLTDTFEGMTVETLLEEMITVSDNHAANVFMNAFGMDTFNAYFAENGYEDTCLKRKMLDYDAMDAGIENYTSVNDVLKFFKKLYEKRTETPYSDMLDLLLRQTRRGKIPANLPEGVRIANKTGELADVQNDVAIVFSEGGDFALALLLSDLSDVGDAITAMSRTAADIYALLN